MEKERESHGLGERERLQKRWRGRTERGVRQVNSEKDRRAFTEFRKGHAAPFRAHYHS